MVKVRGLEVRDLDQFKSASSKSYHYVFNKETGVFARWGETATDDPQMSPYGPEIADIEISTGDCSGGCPWCYKSNGMGFGQHMTLESFRAVLASLPETLTQVALGITDADANPYFIGIMEECRANGIVPNYTTSGLGLTEEIIDASARLCGAVAVSVYPSNWNDAWAAVQNYIDSGLEQVNVHLLFYETNTQFVRKVIAKAEGIEGLNAVVLLGLKPKGGANGWKPLGQDEFESLVESANVRLGFDSCTAPKFELWAVKTGRPELLLYSERCESSLFSIYINVHGEAYPCSFAEGHPSVKPVSVKEAWHSHEFARFRERLLANNRECPLYNV